MATNAGTTVWIATGVWLLVALAVGASGLLRPARPPLPQVLIAALTAAILVLYWTATTFRRWAIAVDVRVLVAVHVTRLIAGADFLVMYRRGQLPYDFAVPGGWGDIVVGVLAIVVCLFARLDAPAGRAVVLIWNVVGLLDILLVVATASRLAAADAQSMRALLELPLSVLPTFLVPIIIATHVIIFARLWGAPGLQK